MNALETPTPSIIASQHLGEHNGTVCHFSASIFLVWQVEFVCVSHFLIMRSLAPPLGHQPVYIHLPLISSASNLLQQWNVPPPTASPHLWNPTHCLFCRGLVKPNPPSTPAPSQSLFGPVSSAPSLSSPLPPPSVQLPWSTWEGFHMKMTHLTGHISMCHSASEPAGWMTTPPVSPYLSPIRPTLPPSFALSCIPAGWQKNKQISQRRRTDGRRKPHWCWSRRHLLKSRLHSRCVRGACALEKRKKKGKPKGWCLFLALKGNPHQKRLDPLWLIKIDLLISLWGLWLSCHVRLSSSCSVLSLMHGTIQTNKILILHKINWEICFFFELRKLNSLFVCGFVCICVFLFALLCLCGVLCKCVDVHLFSLLCSN